MLIDLVEPVPGLSLDEIYRIEKAAGVTFPEPLRALYLIANGGRPRKRVVRIGEFEDGIELILPLKDTPPTESSIYFYQAVVRGSGIIPDNLFPFAMDVAGDMFYADLASSGADVWFFRDDTAFENLFELGVSLFEFFRGLHSESDQEVD